MPRAAKRILWSGAAVLGLLSAPALRAQQPVTPRPAPALEEGLFDLSVTGLPTRSISVLVTPRGTFLLPLGATLEQLGIPVRIARDSGLARVDRGAAGTLTVTWNRAAATRPDTSVMRLDSAEVRVQPAEVYVESSRLATIVGGTIAVDMGTLSVRAGRPGDFPAQQRQALIDRREQALARSAQPSAAAAGAKVPFEPRTGFGVVEWGLSGSGSGVPIAPSAGEARVGLGLWGGMLKTRTTLQLGLGGSAPGMSGEEVSYQRVFPFNPWVRQVQVGDVVSDGAVARGMRGLTLTNAPFVRSLSFDEMPFSRPLPPGWEYEVYEGTRLLGYADAATNTPLRIPLQYGSTPLRVRLYGPAGEVIESAVSYVVPIEQLREGEWQYATGGGRCTYDACTGLAYGEVRRGVSRWLTLQGGLDALGDSVGTNVRPYGAVSYIPSPGWTTSLQAQAKAYLRGSVQNQGDGRVMGGVTAGVNAAGEGGTPISADAEQGWFMQSNLQLRDVVPQLGDHTLSLSLRADGGSHTGLKRWDLSAVAPVRRVLMDVALQSDPRAALGDSAQDGGPLLRIAPTISFGRGFWSQIGSPVMRFEAGIQRLHLAQWEVGASLQPGRSFVSFSVQRLIGTSHPEFSFGATVPLHAARVLSHLATRNGRLEGGYTASGAVAVGTVRRATQLEYGGLGASGLEGLVYRDRDGDGKFGPGDVPVRDAVIQAGGLRTRTDAQGRYALWNVTPYEPLEVVLDTLSLEEPSWTSSQAARALRLSPQQFTRVDYPLRHTREVVGRLTGPGAGDTPGGVTITLRDSAQKLVYETRTFSDGGFYLSQVKPGRYELSVAASSLKALRATLPAVPVVEVKGDADEVIELPALAIVKDPKVP